MGALTFDALLRSLKQGAPDSVYYLHGEEDVLKDEAVRALLDRAVDPAARDFNVDHRTAADLDPEAFNALVNTPPMLTATRAVVLRGMEQLRKTAKVRQEPLHYLDSPNPTTVLVLVHGTAEPPDAELVRRATAVEVAALPPERVERWMTHRAKQLGLTLSPEARELLLASVGTDLSGLARELEKLAPLCAGRPASRDEVAALVGVRRGETLQDFIDAALERRAPQAARLVAPVLEQAGMSGVRMLTAVGTALVGTALARAELDRDAPRSGGPRSDRLQAVLLSHLRTARPYGLGSWEQTALRWAGWAERWTGAELRGALRLALDADRALNSSTLTDEAGILEELGLLTQLYFAQGDPAATVQAAERLRLDYPDSPLRARADFWGARAYFDLKDDAHGCPLIREALDAAGADVEFKNQVTFYASRCASATAAPPVAAPATAGDTQTRPTPPAATYAVQVMAVKSAAQVDEMLTRLKVMGFDARVVRDTSGLFKVRVGRYATHDEAAQVQRRLKTRLGGQPFVVEEP